MWILQIGDIFARARAHQPLTPSERSFLRMIDGLIIFAFISALTAVAPILKGDTPFTLQGLIHVVFLAFIEALGMAVMKLWKAQGDNGLGLNAPSAASPAASSGESVALPDQPTIVSPDPSALAATQPKLHVTIATPGDPGATTLAGIPVGVLGNSILDAPPPDGERYAPPAWLTGAAWEVHVPSTGTSDAPPPPPDAAADGPAAGS